MSIMSSCEFQLVLYIILTLLVINISNIIYFILIHPIPFQRTDDEKKAIHLEKVKKAKEAFLKKILKNVIIAINFSWKIIFIYQI